ncbi:MAG TPA: gephyrin-like molybdotransferase Glp [Thermosynechococcaceae cyanobacterium]
MLSVEQAEQIILDLVQPFDLDRDSETLDLLESLDRVLAQPVVSELDFPHWDNSAMDGYAVRSEDVQNSSAEAPIVLKIVEEIPAGSSPQKSIAPGQAARILTGSVMPPGADTVVMQENTQRSGDRVSILVAPQPQAFVRHRAAYYKAGATLLKPGLRLQAPEIAVLAAAQCTQVRVFRRPKVAILSTGNELVSLDRPLQPGQIVDSNQYALAALVRQLGAEPVLLGIVPDDRVALQRAMKQAIDQADVVLSTGGVSVGDYDHVEEILAALKAEIPIRAVAIKPGKPLTVATFSTTLFFGLPGNPVSALVTFWRFVQPALRKLSGLAHSWKPNFVTAKTRQELRSDGQRETYLWGKLHLVQGEYEFELATGGHSSGNLINLAGTSGLAVLAIGQTKISTEEKVRVLLTSSPCQN